MQPRLGACYDSSEKCYIIEANTDFNETERTLKINDLNKTAEIIDPDQKDKSQIQNYTINKPSLSYYNDVPGAVSNETKAVDLWWNFTIPEEINDPNILNKLNFHFTLQWGITPEARDQRADLANIRIFLKDPILIELGSQKGAQLSDHKSKAYDKLGLEIYFLFIEVHKKLKIMITLELSKK